MGRKSVSQILEDFDNRAPSGTAERWDNVGLLAGDPSWETEGAVVSIDLTAEAIAKAKSRNYRLIVNHHPCIFPKERGLSRITPDSLVFQALQAGIAVAAFHTNFDQCALEVVEAVSTGLGAKPRGRLFDKTSGALTKLVVFIPTSHSEEVREAICEAGAGMIGNYDFCTFGAAGEGTFRGGEGTEPFLGKPGQLEKAKEIRLETVFPTGLKKQVLEALFKSHPYEEVAFDLYPVSQAPGREGLVRGLGYGFWGEIPSSKPFSDFAKDVKSLFNIDGFWLSDPAPSHIRKIAFVAGKGASFIEAAASLGCDLFITGEAGYHDALSGSRRGMAVMELGHRESELFFLGTMEKWLAGMGLGAACLNTATQRIWSGGKT